MPPPIAIVAFGAGLLLVLGVAYLRGRWPPPRRAPRPTERRFRLAEIDSAPRDLYDQLPCDGVLLRSIPGPDRPDYWIARLDRPLRWLDEGTERVIDHLVLAARLQGQSIDAGAEQLMVGVAYVVDPSLLSDATVTFAKIRYVAIGTIEPALRLTSK